MGAGHPECPQRLDAITDHLLATGLDVALDYREAPVATTAQLARAHGANYVSETLDLLQQVKLTGTTRALDPDTVAAPGTLAAALRAAGAAVAATDDVMAGRASNAFCAVRPPGHHATRDSAMGFCFFNNVAVAARHALDVHGLQRVARRDGHVVEEAEAHGAVAGGVVPGGRTEQKALRTAPSMTASVAATAAPAARTTAAQVPGEATVSGSIAQHSPLPATRSSMSRNSAT